jgi:hypothetical protein
MNVKRITLTEIDDGLNMTVWPTFSAVDNLRASIS